MTYQQFGIGFLIAVAVAIAGTFGIAAGVDVGYATAVIITIGIALALICALMFWLGKRTASADNKLLFGNVFMGMTGLKMFLCAGVLVAYIMLGDPPNSLFVIPVFFVYFVFTLLEVVALVMISREAK